MAKRNLFGQQVRARKITDTELKMVRNVIESAMSRGDDEARVFWSEDQKRIYACGVSTREKIRLE